MSIQAKITYTNQRSHTDDSGSTYNIADVFIEIIDENGNPANGNNATVTVRSDFMSTPATSDLYNVPGMNLRIYSGVITRTQSGQIADYHYFTVTNVGAPAANPLPLTCDAHIDSVAVNKKESAPGAADGQITVNAFSSYGPIMYSLDNQHFQTSATFTGLIAGGYTAWITDANGCGASYNFTLDATRNLLISDPSVNLGNGNVSRWNAVFNPIVFSYQRRDLEITAITDYANQGGTLFTINGYVGSVQPKEQIYINAGIYDGVYSVISAQTNALLVDIPYQSSTQTLGFVNVNSIFGYYKIETTVTYQDRLSGRANTIVSQNRPDKTGKVQADLSSFLQSLLVAKDDCTYNAISYRDSNLSASYNISYRECWTDAAGTEHKSEWVIIDHPYFITYTARQLGQKYSGNMAAFVPFQSVSNPNDLAAWVTDFTEPAYSAGYPFDLSFIYSEYLLGLNPYFELTLLDINRQPLNTGSSTGYLLTNNNSYLLQANSSRFIIANGTAVTSPVSIAPDELGLNRLLINPTLVPQAAFMTIVLKYTDSAGSHAVTQTQTLQIDNAVDDRSVYLRWIGLTGSWNYYRFVYNQEVTLDVQNAVIIKNFVADWEAQQGIEEVISKSAGEKMKVMAEDLSIADIKGLQSIKYSPKVQILTSKSPVKWQTVVLNTATFVEYETRYGQYAFSVTFNLPSKNIQSQ
ncbi:hypothetical protein [Mucilaginibacter ginkgonis]|uniref:SprB-like repeat protein n=1 Tax=Mucilaginibacter ginkgonis TaxID=2682091 RepID=A0A6I4HUQ7_9SPHI|nr:hypothetical protein [Mucilaginibacter ginkgonis]QQL50342.1 hypothetical protein GO620_002485 [Mucilaginibacter ginkgonis]